MKASAAWLLIAAVFFAACAKKGEEGGGGSPGGGKTMAGTDSMGLLGQDTIPPAGKVNVSVVCDKPSGVLHANVAPWRQLVDTTKSVEWNLAGNGANELKITPHDTTTSGWPFQNKAPSGTPQQAASSGAIAGTHTRGQRVQYKITVTCDSVTVTIDPELIFPG